MSSKPQKKLGDLSGYQLGPGVACYEARCSSFVPAHTPQRPRRGGFAFEVIELGEGLADELANPMVNSGQEHRWGKWP
jgi:hypothetical protein